MSAASTIAPAALALLLAGACPVSTHGGDASTPAGAFVERGRELGLDFEYWNGMSGRLYLPEIVGGGAALFDADRDGDLDLVVTQGQELLPRGDRGGPPQAPHTLGARFFRNELDPARGPSSLRFVDATATSGLHTSGYGIGVATGDYDGDGLVDLYFANLGANQLWRNQGAGAFREVTAAARADDPRWSTVAVFFDYDRDGWLDLFVGNYVEWSPEIDKVCRTITGRRDYCGPLSYRPERNTLLRNRGDGTFEDQSLNAGLTAEAGSTLGAVAADFDRDGALDLFVANDGMANELWLNQRDGTFRNDALLAGVAVNRLGQAEASMGVALGDADGDLDLDLLLTHLTGETNTFYRNDGGGNFTDQSRESGLGPPSLASTGFGVAFLDADGDDRLDVFVANGAVHVPEGRSLERESFPLEQPGQFYRNHTSAPGQARFTLADADSEPALARAYVGRGVASGDVDNDGDHDLVVVNANGPLRLLLNQTPAGAWLGLDLRPAGSAAHLPAEARVERAGAPTLLRQASTAGSYASTHDPRVLVSLARGPATRIVITWPDGRREAWDARALATGRYHALSRGSGQAVAP